MKITYLTQQTWEKVYEPKNTEPSLTRESDFISIQELFAKFQANDGFYEVFKPIAELSPEEREIVENGADLDELADADLVEQKEFIDSVHDSLLKKDYPKKEEVSEPTQAKPEPEQPVQPQQAEVK